MSEELKKFSDVTRRDFLRLSGIAGAGVVMVACGTPPAPTGDGEAAGGDAAADAPAAEGGASGGDVPREKTLILMMGGVEGQHNDVGLANPYVPGGRGHRAITGSFEPLFYYSAFADEFVPWLAESYEYNDDYTELTVKMREGAEWSDGEAFDAEDVVFTINMLKENSPSLRNSSEVDQWVAEATVVDPLTAKIVFNDPRPRFAFSHLTGKFDTGIYWVPEHVFKDVEDVSSFTFYDPEQGWPLVTGPYTVTDWRPEQQVIDRRDDWWAAKIGFADYPAPERILKIPWSGEERAAQLMINNEIDSALDFRATTISQIVDQNPAVITHTGRELPMGYIDWWPTSLWMNTSEPPFDDPNVRWAVSYSIDRQQMLDVALEGSGILTQLPFPYYPPLMPYIEATAPLLEQYDTSEFNLDKSAERMAAAGYEKDGDGFWVKDGERVPAVIHGFGIFNDIGPVIAEQLRRGGFEAEYTAPADSGTKMSDGTAKIMLFGHGGSITDPFDTLDMYTSKHYSPTGEPAAYFSRWQNEEYDAILEEMAALPPDPNNQEYMDLYLAAVELYLENLVDIPIQQWMHRIAMNETYWNGWPTEENNTINGAFWHQTHNMVLDGLEPASGE